MTAEGLGPFIKRRRAELNMTQQQLANKIGVSQGYLSQIENGSRKWPQKYIHGISRALLVPEPSLAVTAGMIGESGKERGDVHPIDLALDWGNELVKDEVSRLKTDSPMIRAAASFMRADDNEKTSRYMSMLKTVAGFVALTSDWDNESIRAIVLAMNGEATPEEMELIKKVK